MGNEETPPIRLVIPDLLFPDAAAFLRAHGATIEPGITATGIQTTVTLPQGSKRILTTVVTNERYRIDLPDGTKIREVYDSADGHSALFIPAQRSQEANDEQQ